MASKNKLLGSGIPAEEEKVIEENVDLELGWPKRLYHNDCLTGKVFATFPEQDLAKKEGWVESPADLPKEIHFDSLG